MKYSIILPFFCFLIFQGCKKEITTGQNSTYSSGELIIDITPSGRSGYSLNTIKNLYLGHERYDSFGTSIVTVGSTWGYLSTTQNPNFIIGSSSKLITPVATSLKSYVGNLEWSSNNAFIAQSSPAANWSNFSSLFGNTNTVSTILNNGTIQFDTSIYFPEVTYTYMNDKYTDTGYIFTVGNPMKIEWKADLNNPVDVIMLKLRLADVSDQETIKEVIILTDDDGSYSISESVIANNFGANQKINVHFARANYVRKLLQSSNGNFYAYAMVYNQSNMAVFLSD